MTEEAFPRGGEPVTDRRHTPLNDAGGSAARKKRARKRPATADEGRIDVDDVHVPQKGDANAIFRKPFTVADCRPGVLLLACVTQTSGPVVHVELCDGLRGRVRVSPDDHTRHYRPGQLLVCAVLVGNQRSDGRAPVKWVSLTVEPEKVNEGLRLDTVTADSVLMGKVLSEEDRGFTVSLGLKQLQGFLPVDGADERVAVGQRRLFRVSSLTHAGAGTVLRLSAHLAHGKRELKGCAKPADLMPATVVMAKVQTVLRNGGVALTLPNGIKCHLWAEQLPSSALCQAENSTPQAKKAKPAAGNRRRPAAKVGSMLRAVVTAVDGAAGVVKLSAQDILVDLDDCDGRMVFESYEIGTKLTCKVLGVSRRDAVTFAPLERSQRPAPKMVARRSQLDVRDDAQSDAVNERYKPGTEHQCRVVGHKFFDHVVMVSCRKDVLKAKIMSYKDAKPGQLLTCIVERVRTRAPNRGLFVRIAGDMKTMTNFVRMAGFVPEMHTDDRPVKDLDRRFTRGAKLKCRVLSHDIQHERLILTCKPALVSSTLPPITEIRPSLVGKRATGVVVFLQPLGGLVLFYNGVKAWINSNQLPASPYVGQPLTVRISYVDVDAGRVTVVAADYDEKSTPAKSNADEQSSPIVYLPHGGRVTSVGTSKSLGRYFLLQACSPTSGGAQRMLQLPAAYVGDFVCPPDDAGADVLKVGDVVKPLVVVHTLPAGGALVSACPLLCHWFGGDLSSGSTGEINADAGYGLGYSLSSLEEGKLVCGLLARKHDDFGLFVDLPTTEPTAITGLAPYSCVDGGKDAALRPGQTVFAKIKHVDLQTGRVSLQLRARFCYPSDTAPVNVGLTLLEGMLQQRQQQLCHSKQTQSAPTVGDRCTVLVQSYSGDGAACHLADGDAKGRSAIALAPHCSGEAVEAGATMPARVLAVHADGVLEVTLDKKLVGRNTAHSQAARFVEGNRLKVIVADVKSDYILTFVRPTSSKTCDGDSPPIFVPARLHPNETPPVDGRFHVGKQLTVVLRHALTGVGWLASAETDEQKLTAFGADRPKSKTSVKNERSAVLDRRAMHKSVGVGKLCQATVVGDVSTDDGWCRYATLRFASLLVGGRIHASELPQDYLRRDKPLDEFARDNAGKTIKCRVIAVRRLHKAVVDDRGKLRRIVADRVVDCTLNERKMAIEKVTKKQKLDYDAKLRPTDVVDGFVSRVDRHKITVEISPLWRGTLRSLDATVDDVRLARDMSKRYSPGQIVRGLRVTGVNKPKRVAQLSAIHIDQLQICAGALTLARVADADPRLPHLAGFAAVELRAGHRGHMRAVDLCDDYDQLRPAADDACTVDAHLPVVPVAQLADRKNQWVVSARPSVLAGPNAAKVKKARRQTNSPPVDPYYRSAAELPVGVDGQPIRGFVKSVHSKLGVFVAIGAELDGRVPVEDLKWSADCIRICLIPGDLVSVAVRAVDGEKVHLSMMPEHVGGAAHKNNTKLIASRQQVKEEVKGEEQEGAIVSFEAVLSKTKQTPLDEVEIKPDIRTFPKKERVSAPVLSDPGFDFSGASEFAPEKMAAVGLPPPTDEPKPKRKRAKGSAVNGQAPAGANAAAAAAEFDRLLMTSPNSSELWLKYMALFGDNGELDRARATVQRALNVVQVDSERQNIWMAWLNLEVTHGDDDALANTLKQALSACDRFTVYKHMLKACVNNGKLEMADDLCEEMLRKLKQEVKEPVALWAAAGQHYMSTGRADRCRAVMQRALRSAPDACHLQLAVRFAQLEFESPPHGDPERAKTIMENALQSYPKRTDIWCVYADLLARHGLTAEDARAVMRRATGGAAPVGPHKLRALYRKWLELERKHGDEAGLKEVHESMKCANVTLVPEKT